MDNSVKISLANLFCSARNEASGAVETVYFAVRHPTDESQPWQALSAGPKYNPVTQAHLVRCFGADEASFSSDDARCTMPAGMVEKFRQWLEADLQRNPTSMVTWSPLPELRVRLACQYWEEVEPPLTREDFEDSISLPYTHFVRQPPPADGEESGGRGAQVRFFLLRTLVFRDQAVSKRFFKSRAVKQLSRKELESTKGGRCIGQADDGTQLANNIGVEDYQLEM